MNNQLLNYKKITGVWLLIIAIFVLAACGGENDTAENESTQNQSDPDQSISFENIGQGDSLIAEIQEPQAFIAASPEAVEIFSPWLADNIEAVEQLENTNFENEIVLAVFRGLMPSSGYQITINELTAEGTTLNFIVELTDPAADQLLSTVISYPYHVVSVPNGAFDTAETTRWTISDTEGNLLAEGAF